MLGTVGGMADDVLKKVLVKPGDAAGLAKRSPTEDFGWDKESAKAETAKLLAKVDALQTRLAAEKSRGLLFVIQAMDAAGKDGVIRSMHAGLNPAGVHVSSFKAPAGRETGMDFLWRIHDVCPAKGEIGIFNRSHYEDVLVVRVKNFVPRTVWSKRYDHIRNFEKLLAGEGTRIVKIHLQISKEEQRLRLQDRIDDPNEQWKFRLGDLDDRKLWPQFMRAYEDAITETSTTYAPWYVVPADRKWVRNLVVARLLVATLEDMNPKFPPPDESLAGLKVA
jgi:PPK2 family polyphosphate:nucleotide phosphotransferase